MNPISSFFDIHNDLDTRQHTVEQISKSVSFRGANSWILIAAIFIASLGLNVNSTAVIIGAMLISPLMGPIIGMGLAVGTSDFALLKRSLRNYGQSTLISIATATVYFFITPFREVQSELLARTSPTLYDVLIAFFGGAAGIIALCVKDKGNVLPGVAIATALMPPLCTAGFGLATGNLAYFAGAFFLYFINTVFIALATFFGVKMMGFEQHTFVDAKQKIVVQRSVLAIVIVTLIPAGYMTMRIVHNSYRQSQVAHFVHEQLRWDGTQVVTSTLSGDSVLKVVLVGRTVSATRVHEAQMAMKAYSQLANCRLHVIQGGEADSLVIAQRRQNAVNGVTQASPLLRVGGGGVWGAEAERLNKVGKDAAREMQTLFPMVRKVTLTPASEWATDSLKNVKMTLAVIIVDRPLEEGQRQRMRNWLKVKTEADSLRLVVDRVPAASNNK